jgi:hypothetical protein
VSVILHKMADSSGADKETVAQEKAALLVADNRSATP